MCILSFVWRSVCFLFTRLNLNPTARSLPSASSLPTVCSPTPTSAASRRCGRPRNNSFSSVPVWEKVSGFAT